MAGRPSDYSDKLADIICNRLMDGESLRKICSGKGMPDRGTVVRWMLAHADFAAKCARAREAQSDYMDDLILDVANACTPKTAHADKVKISAYQWRASKLAPKKYGDKIAVAGDPDNPMKLVIERLETVIVDPAISDRKDI